MLVLGTWDAEKVGLKSGDGLCVWKEESGESVLVGRVLLETGGVLVPEPEANLEVVLDSRMSGETDMPVPREPDGVFPGTVTVVVTVGWAVLRSETPVLWMTEEDGVISVWVGDMLELV